ncbi:MAG: nicotinamide mononucleotide transporter [Gloeobacteraceae cyanobacterium ES-bin-316]|nr:nicotinamide mononucleotide transporter [Ferruginibacter sp.]
MTISEIFAAFLKDIRGTGVIEFIAVFTGILSVWYSRKENILVYPVGLINTTFYVYLSIKLGLFGEATVNIYYTIMSIYGWMLWGKKDANKLAVLHISGSTKKEWLQQVAFFAAFFGAIFFALSYLKKGFYPNVIPWADALASASAFTGMWLMTRKKTESWIWWMITNLASIPLYFVKHYVLTSVYYLVLLVMAIAGYIEWKKRQQQQYEA